MQHPATKFARLRTAPPKHGRCVPFTLLNLFPNMLVDTTPRGYSFADIEACFGLKLVKWFSPKAYQRIGVEMVVVALIRLAPTEARPAHLVAAIMGLSESEVVLIDTLLPRAFLANAEHLASLVTLENIRFIADENGAAKAFPASDFLHLFEREK